MNGCNVISWDEKFAADIWYVDNQSMALDFRILAISVGKVLRKDGVSTAGEATMPGFRGR